MPLDLTPIRERLWQTGSGFWENDCRSLDDCRPQDREFIYHAPGDVNALLDEVERLRSELAKVAPHFIVRLEPGVWIAGWNGDPERTTVKASAKRFPTERSARRALSKARRFREFPKAVVECVK